MDKSDPSPRSGQFNLRHLRAFIAVAHSGSVTKAAERLLRAQSVVTRAVRQLEASIGLPLFERRAQGVELTLYGRTLLKRALRAAAEFEQARVDMQPLCGRGLPSPTAPIFSMQASHGRLAAFLTLLELHHMRDVAQRLDITQSAVSAAIRELEGGLRTPLFLRTTTGLIPTPAARVLARRVRLALAELRHAIEELAALQGITAGHARVGVLALSRAAIIVPRAIARIVSQHPAVHVTLREGAFDTQEESLRSGDIDFVFGALRDWSRDVELVGEELFVDRLCLIVRGEHPLAGRPHLSLHELQAYPWILNRPETPGRERLEVAFQRRGIPPPRVAIETGSLAMTRALMLERDFITALSAHQFEREIAAGLLALLPLDLPETARSIGIIRRRNSVLPPSAELLIEALREVVHET